LGGGGIDPHILNWLRMKVGCQLYTSASFTPGKILIPIEEKGLIACQYAVELDSKPRNILQMT
jgi:hypothetical protein